MTKELVIESKKGNLINIKLKEGIKWSTAVYGQTLFTPFKKVIAKKLGIIGKFDGQPFDLFLREAHHQSYGRPWVTGKYQLDFMETIGLKPNHKLLDFGCGSGRFGVRVINYLNKSNYFGLDFHLPSLQAFAKYELILNDLTSKNPRLLKDDEFNFGHFDEKFNWVMDFYVSHHLNDADYQNICKNAYDTLKIDGKYVLSPPNESMKKCMIDNGFAVDIETKQDCDILKYHGCEDFNEWVVFKKL